MGAAIVVVVAVQNRYLRTFLKAGATDPVHARPLAELGLRDGRLFRGLVRRGLVLEAAGGFYVIPEVVEERRRRVQKRARILLMVMVAAAVVVAVIVAMTRVNQI